MTNHCVPRWSLVVPVETLNCPHFYLWRQAAPTWIRWGSSWCSFDKLLQIRLMSAALVCFYPPDPIRKRFTENKSMVSRHASKRTELLLSRKSSAARVSRSVPDFLWRVYPQSKSHPELKRFAVSSSNFGKGAYICWLQLTWAALKIYSSMRLVQKFAFNNQIAFPRFFYLVFVTCW